MTLYVLIADGSIDQVCETEATARRETKWLREMGCTVRVKQFFSWAEFDAFEAKFRGY